MGADRYTIDTNILFYALDKGESAKQYRALRTLELLRGGMGFLVLQTLGELCNSTARKRPALLPAAQRYASRAVDAFTIVAANPEDLNDALSAQQGHGLQFWDALLWATARRAGCTILLSEDFQDGRILGGVTFRSPFHMAADEFAALYP